MKLIEGTIKSNNLNVVLDLEENIRLHSYPNELNQCLINIFNNAKDVLKDVSEDDRYFFINAKKEKDQLILRLLDSGGGIKDDIILKIFEPYFTTKHKSQGTGLGLHMTYNIITDGLKGSIEASNQTFDYDGHSLIGAQFTIKIPLSI